MMKLTNTLLLLFVFLSVTGQETITKSFTHDGAERSYIVYIPEVYDEDNSVPLVLNFHGFGGQATDQMWYGDFRYIADTANFIIIHPQGLVHNGSTHWNVGGWIINSPADDVDFIDKLIDEISNDYNINPDKIYATGMSNGGFFSFLLGCELSDKIAAIASVTGSMTPNNFNSCNPQRPIPIMQIHGTSDQIVSYTGEIWTKPVSEVISYWVEHNKCDQQPITFDLPDTNPNDGSTVTFSRYENGEQGSVVEHLRVNNGGHTWPGTVFTTAGTNYDFLASDAIWQFFNRYDLNGKLSTSTSGPKQSKSFESIYNPTSRTITVDRYYLNKHYSLITADGTPIDTGILTNPEISTSDINNGIYFLVIEHRVSKILVY